MGFSEVKEAIDAIGRLGMAVVVDDEDRENEGDLVMAAEAATPENIAFFLAHTSGVICVPLLPERADALELPLMVTANTEAQRTAFTVSVDFRHGTSTGISAADRAATISALIDPKTLPTDLNRPGHRGQVGDGSPARARTLRQEARSAHHLDSRADPLPAPEREVGPPRLRGPYPGRGRAVPCLRLRVRPRWRAASGARHGRCRRSGGRAGPGALRVPDGRRLRLAAL